MKHCSRCRKEIPDNSIYCMYCGLQVAPRARNPRHRGNGTGSVFKVNGRWKAQVTLGYYLDKNGKMHKKVRTKQGFKTKKEAEAYLPKLFGRPEKSHKVSYYWSIYAETELRTISENRQRQYEKVYQEMTEIHDRDIADLDLRDLQRMVDSVGTTYYTCNYAKTVLSKIYTEAMRDQAVYQNLALLVVLPPKKEEEAKAFTRDEIAKIWETWNSGDLWEGYILTMIYTGMMPGELMGLTKNMVNLEAQMITGAGKKPSPRKQAPIMLADAIVPVLRQLMEASDSLMVCPYSKDAFYRQYHKAIVRAGCRDLPPYSCRHTTGTAVALATQDPEIVKLVMRHANISTTQRYIHLGKDQMLNAVNAIDGTVKEDS